MAQEESRRRSRFSGREMVRAVSSCAGGPCSVPVHYGKLWPTQADIILEAIIGVLEGFKHFYGQDEISLRTLGPHIVTICMYERPLIL